jgi:hypothetical protein
VELNGRLEPVVAEYVGPNETSEAKPQPLSIAVSASRSRCEIVTSDVKQRKYLAHSLAAKLRMRLVSGQPAACSHFDIC